MDLALAEIEPWPRGEINKQGEIGMSGRIKRLFRLLIYSLMDHRALNKFKVFILNITPTNEYINNNNEWRVHT